MIGKQFTNLNRGVSPVVGVILMVAVTVILAAVIGSVVLDLGSGVSQSAQAGVNFESDGSSVDVQLTTVQAADSIWVTTDNSGSDGSEYEFSGGDSTTTTADEVDSAPSNSSQFLLSRSGTEGGVGTIVTYAEGTSGISGDQLSVVGEVDGESTVIQTYTVE